MATGREREGGTEGLMIERQELVETGGGHMGGGPHLTLHHKSIEQHCPLHCKRKNAAFHEVQ